MAIFTAEIESRWTADETFSYLADFSNAEQWDPGVLQAERLDNQPERLDNQHERLDNQPGRPDNYPPVQVGSQFRLLVPFLGGKLAMIYRVTSISCEHSIEDLTVTFAARHPLLLAHDRITVRSHEPVSLDSTVSYQAEVSLRGPLKLLDPLLSKGFQQVGQRAADGLAQLLSTDPPDYADPADDIELLDDLEFQNRTDLSDRRIDAS